MKIVDLKGQRFGKLLVKEEAYRAKRKVFWKCKCDCGKCTVVPTANLRSGNSSSCGCFRYLRCIEANLKHGHCRKGTCGVSPTYRSWVAMVNRCTRSKEKAYPAYGGRGIRVCKRWLVFDIFLNDMGPRPSINHSIDRMDNYGHYEPNNCRWATRKQQRANRRDSK